jgi:hypothetical protein
MSQFLTNVRARPLFCFTVMCLHVDPCHHDLFTVHVLPFLLISPFPFDIAYPDSTPSSVIYRSASKFDSQRLRAGVSGCGRFHVPRDSRVQLPHGRATSLISPRFFIHFSFSHGLIVVVCLLVFKPASDHHNYHSIPVALFPLFCVGQPSQG